MSMKRIVLVTLFCIVVTAGVLAFARAAQASTTLMVHAGAGIRPPLDELGKRFEQQTGTRVDYNFKGSGCLLADICFSKKGDAYIPGELFYIEQADKRGMLAKSRIVAQMSTVVIVQKGNPKKINSLKDLTRPGLRVGIGDPEAVAVGRAANESLVKAGILGSVKKNIATQALNVVELGIGVKLRHLDAAIVWDATAYGADRHSCKMAGGCADPGGRAEVLGEPAGGGGVHEFPGVEGSGEGLPRPRLWGAEEQAHQRREALTVAL